MALDPKVELAIFAFVIASLYLLHTKVVTPIFAEWSIKEKLKKRYELTFERYALCTHGSDVSLI
jgi:hypothetical protein